MTWNYDKEKLQHFFVHSYIELRSLNNASLGFKIGMNKYATNCNILIDHGL